MSDGADVTSVAVTLAWDPAGPLDLGRLTAPVPGTPPYRAKDVLDLSEVRLTEGRISALADGGLHRAACCGDITGHGAISALDGTRVLQEVVGLDRAEIPPLPGIVVPPLGRDPHVQLGSGSGRPGRSVTVPLTLDDAQGLEAADFRLTFDPSRLTLTPQGVRPGPLVAGGTFLVHTPAPGTLTAGLTTPTPRPAGGGTLLTLDFQVPPTAPPGPTPLDL